MTPSENPRSPVNESIRAPRASSSGAHFTVETLVSDPLLRTTVVAGDGGLFRAVTWAHTCELSDPWNWMGPGDLLMSDGYGFPADQPGQETFIRNLAVAGIVGLTLAEGFVAPALSDGAAAVANELNFPVLRTARSVPFVTIGRAVAESNYDKSALRAAKLLRMYSTMRRTHSRELNGKADLLTHLGRELDAALNVVSLRWGRELVPAVTALPAPTSAAIIAHARSRGGLLTGFSRLVVGEGQEAVFLLPIGSSDTAALVVRPAEAGGQADLVLAQHAAMICGLEVDREEARVMRARDRGAALVGRMLEGSVAPEAAAGQLRSLGVGAGPWRVMAWRQPRPPSVGTESAVGAAVEAEGVREELALADWVLVARRTEDTLVVVVPAMTNAAETLSPGATEAGAVVGISQPFVSTDRFADALREARWALEGAVAAGSPSAEYGSQGSYFMPRTVAEGETAVRRLLGSVIDYDAVNSTDLVNSLRVFFAVNRSWQEGARRLGIHKQTLVYRIKKVEELTSTDLRDFGTQAELYLALRTWDLLRLP